MEKLKLNHIKIETIMIRKSKFKEKRRNCIKSIKGHARFTYGFLVAKRENSTIECGIGLKIQQTFQPNTTAL